ncbi:ferredoxin [Rhodoblastus sphagnicola]|uniref:Ferredoxin n=1 Tax=Rhodoblastus sphagnicola TaxID=333368 RepID=A0A2S6NEC9_9HYPH|nr:2Fe-2S iron-sulfur cluster-binding protein [Rhodoblastus sphagnicola]MBB4199867.1 2Fe-2S ferredoxin [Rhodoblastus sphagnicola]PPQ32924.1 ferredoxin [Rhodoblastus sphagnicola]
MTRITFIEPQGAEVEIDIADGWTLMQAATSQGVEGIEAECGGSCACATCHCYIEGEPAAHLPTPTQTELEMLDNVVAARLPNSRLSCQIKMAPDLEGLIVRMPEAQS